MKFCTYILDNTVKVVRLKNFGWEGCFPLLGANLIFIFLGVRWGGRGRNLRDYFKVFWCPCLSIIQFFLTLGTINIHQTLYTDFLVTKEKNPLVSFGHLGSFGMCTYIYIYIYIHNIKMFHLMSKYSVIY